VDERLRIAKVRAYRLELQWGEAGTPEEGPLFEKWAAADREARTASEVYLAWRREHSRIEKGLSNLRAFVIRREKAHAAAERARRRAERRQLDGRDTAAAQAREVRHTDELRQAEIERAERERRAAEQWCAAKDRLRQQAEERAADRERQRALQQLQITQAKQQRPKFSSRAERRAARQEQRRERDGARSYQIFERGKHQ
jgi:hypothetical protein